MIPENTWWISLAAIVGLLIFLTWKFWAKPTKTDGNSGTGETYSNDGIHSGGPDLGGD